VIVVSEVFKELGFWKAPDKNLYVKKLQEKWDWKLVVWEENGEFHATLKCMWFHNPAANRKAAKEILKQLEEKGIKIKYFHGHLND
jgi:hypothetical protein